MSGPLLPERFLVDVDDTQPELPLASEGVQRYVWESGFGRILIEVSGDDVFVNRELVERAAVAFHEFHGRQGDA